MPDHTLLCHPASACAVVQAISVTSELVASGELILHYRIQAKPGELRLPASPASGPADGLWQHTCCEAFIATADSTAYREFNFSPSGQWAIYDFGDYRKRADHCLPTAPPRIAVHTLADGFLLQAKLSPDLLPAASTWQVGLCAVIEGADGDKSYWALYPPAAQPDFHRRQSFVLTLHRAPP